MQNLPEHKFIANMSSMVTAAAELVKSTEALRSTARYLITAAAGKVSNYFQAARRFSKQRCRKAVGASNVD